MKTTKNLLSAFFILYALFSFSSIEAQWTRVSSNVFLSTSTDNVGIGLTAPTQKLEVAGTVKAASALIGDSPWGSSYSCFRHSSCTTTGNYALLQQSNGSTYLNAASGQPIHFRINNATKMTLASNGYIGIGTTSPTKPLSVDGDANINGHIFVASDKRLICGTGFSHGLNIFWSEEFQTSYIDFVTGNLNFRNGDISPLVLQDNGNVAIGMNTHYTPNHDYSQGYRLAVNGGILCEEVKVISDVPSSDYVFEKDYKLLTLQEVEAYIAENKHLPETPSAQEFKENGYKVGEMDDLLLRKVEELTLYVIEQNKRIEALEAENKILKNN